jgi:dipeptidyl aminopeptidase/acylaminoacyl peptidase
MGTKVKQLICCFLLLMATCSVRAEVSGDTLKSWTSRFFTIGNLNSSDDGRWVTVKKWYGMNIDTIMVFDSQKPGPIGNLVKMPNYSFTKNDCLFAFGTGKALSWNLKNNTQSRYNNVKTGNSLSEVNNYWILGDNGDLKLYDTNGNIVNKLTNVQAYATDGKRMLYICRQNGLLQEIVELSGSKTVKRYSTGNKIIRMEIPPSHKRIILIEEEQATKELKATFINVANGVTSSPQAFPLEKSQYLSVKEIKDGKAYMLTFESWKLPIDKVLVDIWYGNDGNLQSSKSLVKNFYWQYGSDKASVIPDEKFSSNINIDNDRYFLSFNYGEDHNYIRGIQPDLDIHIYDIVNGTYRKLGAIQSLIYVSKNGSYILYPDTKDSWKLTEMRSLATRTILDSSLKNPVFSDDNKFVFFESEDGISRYDIQGDINKPFKIGTGKTATIINQKKRSLVDGYRFYQNTVKIKTPIVVKLWDKIKNVTSYVELQNDHLSEVYAPNTDYIKDLKYDQAQKKIFAIEENYNKPAKLFSFDVKEKNKTALFAGNGKDTTAFSLKQDIINFRNSEGISLKGVLYYPANFNPSKKYPMVVSIYEVQSGTSNRYNMPFYNTPIGFDLRILQQRGYFVYLPDIVFGKKGTGLSALDCVNRSLDAIASHPNIDFDKLGLTGHSHGGYETNFIASNSKRFAAYISGAGNSDIVRSYFSYNYNFNSPFYWQFEKEQYKMNVPFAENKGLYFQNSPIHNVENVTAPILLWAGKNDENIAWDQVMEFYIGLRRNYKEVIALFYPNKGHDMGWDTKESGDLSRRTLEWWDFFLKNKKNVPWINKQTKKT